MILDSITTETFAGIENHSMKRATSSLKDGSAFNACCKANYKSNLFWYNKETRGSRRRGVPRTRQSIRYLGNK